jgi:hypothetical protein
MANVKSQPHLIGFGHPNELNAGLAALRPAHDAEVNTHRPALLKVYPQLNTLAGF